MIRAFGPPTLSAQQVLELNRSLWQRDQAATFAICDSGDRCTGHVFVNLTSVRRATVGYWLLPEARGNGFGDACAEARLPVGASRAIAGSARSVYRALE